MKTLNIEALGLQEMNRSEILSIRGGEDVKTLEGVTITGRRKQDKNSGGTLVSAPSSTECLFQFCDFTSKGEDNTSGGGASGLMGGFSAGFNSSDKAISNIQFYGTVVTGIAGVALLFTPAGWAAAGFEILSWSTGIAMSGLTIGQKMSEWLVE